MGLKNEKDNIGIDVAQSRLSYHCAYVENTVGTSEYLWNSIMDWTQIFL